MTPLIRSSFLTNFYFVNPATISSSSATPCKSKIYNAQCVQNALGDSLYYDSTASNRNILNCVFFSYLILIHHLRVIVWRLNSIFPVPVPIFQALSQNWRYPWPKSFPSATVHTPLLAPCSICLRVNQRGGFQEDRCPSWFPCLMQIITRRELPPPPPLLLSISESGKWLLHIPHSTPPLHIWWGGWI